ncbi:hypothetical protein NUACC21_10940 [Scytonema sp. NUACC21]
MTFSFEELKAAWLQVRLGTRSAGIDGITTDLFAGVADEQLRTIQRQLWQESYLASPAKGFYIPKKSGEKRLIGISTVRDRIIQRSLLDELYFPLEDTFLNCSYAYRPGRNIQQAVQHLFSYYQYRPSWVIKANPVKVVSRPPKACNLVKPYKFPTAPISHYWNSEMTTLYITDQGAYLSVKNQQFQVLYNGELKIKVPVNRVSHIVLFGCCNLSHGAVSIALQRRIPVMYLSQKGKYFGRLETEGQAKVEYLVRQVQCCQNLEFTKRQAEAIVEAKLQNSRILLLRLNQKRKVEEVSKAIHDISVLIGNLPLAESIDVLRGYEGKGATIYFQALGKLFTGAFAFEKRTKRPPTDPVNSLLSLGYTLLSQNIYSFVQAVGLHTHFGNLHVPRDNHPALVSDLIEEFRALVVDSLVVYVINSKIFTPEDFTPPDERGGVYLFPDALKKFLKHWEERLQTEVTHPHTGYKVSYRRCIELQVREYVSSLMGEIEPYRPMRWSK